MILALEVELDSQLMESILLEKSKDPSEEPDPKTIMDEV
jgi:hypothetical protein